MNQYSTNREIQYLFGYGTLMSVSNHEMHHALRHNSTYLGKAEMKGVIFDLGLYPAAIYDESASEIVKGEIYQVKNPNLFGMLDLYEGSSPVDPLPREYRRIKVRVTAEDQRHYDAWIYQYNGPIRHFASATSTSAASQDLHCNPRGL